MRWFVLITGSVKGVTGGKSLKGEKGVKVWVPALAGMTRVILFLEVLLWLVLRSGGSLLNFVGAG